MTFSPISRTNLLTLASASPRRKRLLKQIGLPFRTHASRVPEEGVEGPPEHVSPILAEKKASEVYARTGAGWVLGADTLVVADAAVLGKPRDDAEAKRMLGLLSGREHRVVTGFCILNPEGQAAHSEAVTTRVRFRTLTDDEIAGYVATGEPSGKAGSYAIQGMGAFMVSSISGSYTNVVGLPCCALIQALLALKALKTYPLPAPSGR